MWRRLRDHWRATAILVGLVVFALLGALYVADGFTVRIDRAVAREAYEFATGRPAVREFFIRVTYFGEGRTLTYAGTVLVIAIALRRECLRALVYAVGQLAGRSITPFFKGQFQRSRPEYVDWADYSFPSGHAFGSAMVYGLVAYTVARIWAGSRLRWPLAGAAVAFAMLIGLSRIMMGVHYLSDVIAGLCLGMAYGVAIDLLANRVSRINRSV
jgi:undecaprenyl-diphosphatase